MSPEDSWGDDEWGSHGEESRRHSESDGWGDEGDRRREGGRQGGRREGGRQGGHAHEGGRPHDERARRDGRGGGPGWERRQNDGFVDRLLAGTNTWLNACIGAVAAFIFSFIPFSTVLGGAVAGYLEAGPDGYGATIRDGLTVGGITGVFMFVPFIFVAFLFFGLAAAGAPAFGGFLLIVFLFVALYTIGAGMVGGAIGVYARQEIEDRPERRRGW